ncbi:MAG: transketolase [Halobacteriales archaeon]|nr:transketolase [Halobacteriales archaeon]
MAGRDKVEVGELPGIARQVRVDVLDMTYRAQSGHPGGSFSATEALVTLYFRHLHLDPGNPRWADRDRFVLSKGHCSPAMYAVLAARGFFPKSELQGFRKLGRMLQGHVDLKVPGVEFSAGSLGQGLSFANGIALGLRLDRKDARVYCMMGDGEQQEGQVWEAAMTAAHYKLDNVCAIVDNNQVSQTGFIKDTKNIEPLHEKYRAFGWNVERVNGQDCAALDAAFTRAAQTKGKPTVVIADTKKGAGVSFMELRSDYHGRALTDDEMQRAMKELGQAWTPPAKGGA